MRGPRRPGLALLLAGTMAVQASCASPELPPPPHRIVVYHPKRSPDKKTTVVSRTGYCDCFDSGPAPAPALSDREKIELFRKFVTWERERQASE